MLGCKEIRIKQLEYGESNQKCDIFKRKNDLIIFNSKQFVIRRFGKFNNIRTSIVFALN